MKNLTLKIITALLTFTIGVASLWASDIFSLIPPLPEPPTSFFEETSSGLETPLATQQSGNIELRFKQLLKGESGLDSRGEFELINNSANPVSYSSCGFTIRHGKIKNVVNNCHCGTGDSAILQAGETATIIVYGSQIREQLKLKKIKGRFGFNVSILVNKKWQYRELWSEEIEF